MVRHGEQKFSVYLRLCTSFNVIGMVGIMANPTKGFSFTKMVETSLCG